MADRATRDAELYQHMRRCQLSNHTLDFSHLNELGGICVDPAVSSPPTKARKRSIEAALEDEAIRDRLDHVLAIPGLQYGMMLGTFHEIKAMKCNQEVVHYLQHILDTWQNLMPEDPAAIHKLDLATVEALELKCPKHSVHDKERLEDLMNSGQILQAFNTQERQIVYQNILATDCILPSLRSFFADFRYLEHCAKCFCHLIGISGSKNQTINATLEECFQSEGHGRFEIQTSESSFVATSGSPELQFDLGRKQIWLFIMRRCLSRVPPRRKSKGRFATAVPQILQSGELRELARLALRQGFRNDHIESLAGLTRDINIVPSTLSQGRTSSVFEHVPEWDVSLPNQPEDYASTLQLDGLRAPRDDCIWRDAETSRRSGWPYAAEHTRDQPYMFLDVLTDSRAPVSGITSLFVRRCVFNAFFGRGTCGYNMAVSRDGTNQSHRRTSCYSAGSSLTVGSADPALVHRASPCVTEELDESPVNSDYSLRRRESRSRVNASRTPRESRSRLGASRVRRHASFRAKPTAAAFMVNGPRPSTVARSRMRPILPHERPGTALSSPAQSVILAPENKAHMPDAMPGGSDAAAITARSPIEIPGPRDTNVGIYLDWHGSYVNDPVLKQQFRLCGSLTLAAGYDLEQLWEDQSFQFLVDGGVKVGVAKQFIRDIERWAADYAS